MGEDALRSVRNGKLAHVQQLLAHHAEELLRLAKVGIQVLDARCESGVMPRFC